MGTRWTYIWRTLIEVGDRSIYGMKLVNMCHGSNASTLDSAYTNKYQPK